MLRQFFLTMAVIGSFAVSSFAQEHRVEVIKESPEVEGLSEEMKAKLPEEGLKVVRGSSRTVCEVWPCKEWEIDPDVEQTRQRLYPFKPGQLIGFLQFSRRGKDFRDQTISSGWYTLRYGLQPIDGNHVGTSPTRDFLLLVRVEDDESPEPMDSDDLALASGIAAQSAHPAMLCLQRPAEDAPESATVRHDEDNDWWILNFTGQSIAGDKKGEQPVSLVVIGHANE